MLLEGYPAYLISAVDLNLPEGGLSFEEREPLWL